MWLTLASDHNTRTIPRMGGPISRRHVLIGGALLLTGCGRRRDNGYRSAPPASAPKTTAPVPSLAKAVQPRQYLPYYVQSGDTLSSISRRSNVSVANIVSYNHLKSHVIKPGQRLLLPGVSRIGADPLAPALERNELAQARKSADWGRYTIVRRSSWTTKKVRKNHRPMNGITRITLHHTGEYKGMIGKTDKQIIQAIENYHRNGRKWSAIGYHYLVGRDGNIYEGRPAHIQGAHVSGGNKHNLGISVVGDFERKAPNARQLATLKNFLDDMRSKYKVPRKRVYGHRDIKPSICPGTQLYKWLQKYKKGRV